MNTEILIQQVDGPAERRLTWDNRKVRQDRFLFWFFVLFWAGWAPATVFATRMIFCSDARVFFSIWCIFGWFGTLGIPYALLQRSWSEWISLSPELLVHGQEGLLAPKPRQIPTNAVHEIGIGHYDPNERESVVTLNVFYCTPKKRKVRHIVGYWLHPTLKEEVFRQLQDFAGRNQLPLNFTRY